MAIKAKASHIIGSLAAIAVLAAAVTAWQHHYPASPMFAQLGIPGPRADTDRHCVGQDRLRFRVLTPTRLETCWGSVAAGPFFDQQTVELDRVTRRITRADRTWTLPDSVAWSTSQDSIRHVLAAAGGQRLACRTVASDLITSVEAWRFATYSVRLVAYSFSVAQRGHCQSVWRLQLDGYLGEPADCRSAGSPT